MVLSRNVEPERNVASGELGDGTQPSPIRLIEITNRVDRMSLSYGNYGALRAHMKAPDAQLETMLRDFGTRQRALGLRSGELYELA